MIKVKLGLDKMTDPELIALVRVIVDRMGENAATFATPNPPLVDLTAKANELESKLNARAALSQQLQNMTVEIREISDELKRDVTKEAGYVEDRADGSATIIGAAGMGFTEKPGPVGPLPKVEGLAATQGDQNGEIDLQWTPIPRGTKTYTVEISEAVGGQEGYQMCASVTKSSTTLTGLTSGKRYWFRVRAVGASGAGPASEPVTRTAP